MPPGDASLVSDKTRQQKVNWQPISALPPIASMIDGLLDEVEKQFANLRAGRIWNWARRFSVGCVHAAVPQA